MPAEFDLVSMDCCEPNGPLSSLPSPCHSLPYLAVALPLPLSNNGPLPPDAKPSYENASMEVAYTQAYYNENIFPSLQKHQRVLLVPGTFACQDMGQAASDTEVALKLELYLAWAESDKRIVGFNPVSTTATPLQMPSSTHLPNSGS